MAPGVFQLRTACCSLVIPIRIAFCIPLLICTLDGYSHLGTVAPAGPIPAFTDPVPIFSNSSLPPGADKDATDGMSHLFPLYLKLLSMPRDPAVLPGRTLTLAFAALAMMFSVISLVLSCCYPADDEHARSYYEEPVLDKGLATGGSDDDTLNEAEEDCARERVRRRRVGSLLMGTATRLLLAALGTIAFVKVISERAVIKPASYAAIEGLGWTVVVMLYFGVLHRVWVLLCDPALRPYAKIVRVVSADFGAVGDLYRVLFDAARRDLRTPHGRESYYFAENGEFSVYEVANELAGVLYWLGQGRSPEPETLTDEERLQLKTNEDLLASIVPEVLAVLAGQ
ncbi:hypothetical protein BV25DRAFT_1841287 [Artomyces pyxidatus]|uniref:Uncharacterized protein n=1 Tax=Artomyces pyxidatus TaxID=48021 RepID=A0ACB8SP21_9AGAM|nr:hypothetical protein BV25DRAFT_1841287 [Artomyces pyxidatus]